MRSQSGEKISITRELSSTIREAVSSTSRHYTTTGDWITKQTEKIGRDSLEPLEEMWGVCRTESESRESTTGIEKNSIIQAMTKSRCQPCSVSTIRGG